MADEGSDQTTVRVSQDALLLQAVGILRIRYEEDDGYHGLSPAEAKELGQTLTDIIEHSDHDDRDQAIALAHRLIDNDHPEASPLWPQASGRA